jgi:tetratricopeptide (TPR) repeat protein
VAQDRAATTAEEERRRVAEVDMLYAMHRRLDPIGLLGVPEDASPSALDAAFVAFAQRFAPWELGGETGGRATALLLAGARAYVTLADPSTRQEVLERRRPQPTVPVARPGPETERIRTDLLDPVVQFAKGKTLMQEGRLKEAVVQLEYASDLDPQNPDYRAELAYCRFLHDPERGSSQALEELEDVLRIERSHGLALYYAGEIYQRLGKVELARGHFEKAIKPLAGDRRPIDALRALTAAKK